VAHLIYEQCTRRLICGCGTECASTVHVACGTRHTALCPAARHGIQLTDADSSTIASNDWVPLSQPISVHRPPLPNSGLRPHTLCRCGILVYVYPEHDPQVINHLRGGIWSGFLAPVTEFRCGPGTVTKSFTVCAVRAVCKLRL
jgi:hypothetical protein